jgi:hypothetical protein
MTQLALSGSEKSSLLMNCAMRIGDMDRVSWSVKRIRVKVAVKCPRKCRESAKHTLKRTLRRTLNRVTYSDTLNRLT